MALAAYDMWDLVDQFLKIEPLGLGDTIMEMRDRETTRLRVSKRVGNRRSLARIAFGLAVIGAMLLLESMILGHPASAQLAQAVCGEHGEILANLEKFHAERPRGIAISADGKLLEVVVSSNGSWSILLTRPDKRTCVVATGESWQSLPAVAKDPAA